jgi:PAS domain S-box-containing protein
MENLSYKFLNNLNSIYYLLSILAILYTGITFFSNRFRRSNLFNCLKLITEVPEKINQIQSTQHTIYTEIKLQHKIINAILDKLEIAQFLCDCDGKCIKVNAKWVSLTGLTESEALGHNWLLSVHPEDREDVQEKWNNMIQNNAPFEEVFRYQNRVNQVITKVKCTATDILDENNIRVFILGLSKVIDK